MEIPIVLCGCIEHMALIRSSMLDQLFFRLFNLFFPDTVK